MSSSRLMILAAVLVLGGVAVWLSGVEQREDAQAALFPALTLDTLNAVKRVTVIERSTQIASVYRDDEKVWRVAEHYDHPADTVKIRQLLSDLKDAIKIEQKTASPEYYALLGVADPMSGEGTGRLLKLTSADASWQLIVGNPSQQASRGRYVRKPDEAESWLVNVPLDVSAVPTDWLDEEIVHIEPSDISTMTLTHPDDEQPFVVVRSADQQLTIMDLPQGRTAKEHLLRRIASVPDYLQFKAVYPREDSGIDLPEQFISAQMMTQDDLSLTIQAYKSEDNTTYFTLDAAGTSARAEALKQNLSKWLYEVSNSIYANLDKRLDDFLKDS